MASRARKKSTDVKSGLIDPPFDYTDAERHTLLDRARELKMARSTHAYVRGNTRKFYEWLAVSPVAKNVWSAPVWQA